MTSPGRAFGSSLDTNHGPTWPASQFLAVGTFHGREALGPLRAVRVVLDDVAEAGVVRLL